MAVASIGSTLALMLALNMVGPCGSQVKIIVCIEDPEIIEKILSGLDVKADAPVKVSRIATGIAIYQLIIRKLMKSEKFDRPGFYLKPISAQF
ncbi:MAG: hypothetical protein ACI9R8_002415 [Candidatus Paceibacteria bacterium]|jgi:hypothetical protein